ncbi:hypothetical protein JCGZ_12196 [Jatropha curcas]|uniref:Uncharacterized protein n=1 Tax=Jatropha curcas TaxID=180498 RepID=A0A067LE28_JATCU|nr:hypothetical protein JCGZ_12196 [Jatropha curcas]
MKWLYKLIVHYIYPKSASLTYVNQVELCIMWHIVDSQPMSYYFDKMQNNPKKLPYGMVLTPMFEFLNVDLKEKEAEKKKKKEEKGKAKIGEIEKEEKIEETRGEEKKLEEEKKEETEKEKTTEKEAEKEEETEEKKESGKVEKGKRVEEVNDAETEKLELSDEEKSTESKQKKNLNSYQLKGNQSLIESLERMKDVNERKLATLKVKGTPYTPTLEKPKKVKHTAGKHRTHGRKPPLHHSSKRPESSSETAPAQNLRSSKRLRTDPKPL